MSAAAQDCQCACPDPTVVEIPGSPGENGAAGADGLNAFSVTTANFVVPIAAGNTVAISVENNEWAATGLIIFVSDDIRQATFSVVNRIGDTTITGEWLDYPGDSAGGVTIISGAIVTPSGPQPEVADPLPIANGGTGADNATTAIAAFGLGQNIVRDSDNALAFNITNSYTSVGLSVETTLGGLYLFLGEIVVLYTGVTFAASRILSYRIRNVTQNQTISEGTCETGIQTTATFPACCYQIPYATMTTANGDDIEIQVFLDTVESAGSSVVTGACLVAVPLSLTV